MATVARTHSTPRDRVQPALVSLEPDGSWRITYPNDRAWSADVARETNKQIEFYARKFRFGSVQADEFRSKAFEKVFIGWTTRKMHFKKAIEQTVYRVGLDVLRSEGRHSRRLVSLHDDAHAAPDSLDAVAVIVDLETRYPEWMAIGRRLASGDRLETIAREIAVPWRWLKAEFESWRAHAGLEV